MKKYSVFFWSIFLNDVVAQNLFEKKKFHPIDSIKSLQFVSMSCLAFFTRC